MLEGGRAHTVDSLLILIFRSSHSCRMRFLTAEIVSIALPPIISEDRIPKIAGLFGLCVLLLGYT